MGREIRRVPEDWQHPVDEQGRFIPMYDRTFEDDAREWMDNAKMWDDGTHPDITKDPQLKESHPFYWMWHGNPPDENGYRPAFVKDALSFQVYETVSEGTPVSPVLATKEDVVSWAIAQGHSEEAARSFVKYGSVPSMVVIGGKLYSGIDGADK